jgi:hypothetical protein
MSLKIGNDFDTDTDFDSAMVNCVLYICEVGIEHKSSNIEKPFESPSSMSDEKSADPSKWRMMRT